MNKPPGYIESDCNWKQDNTAKGPIIRNNYSSREGKKNIDVKTQSSSLSHFASWVKNT